MIVALGGPTGDHLLYKLCLIVVTGFKSNVLNCRAEGAFTGTAAAPGPEISDFPCGHIKFSTVRRIEPPIHPLGTPKMRCGMSLPTHKALRNRFLERFYVGDFFYPTSKIENFREKMSHFFLEKSKIEKFQDFSIFRSFFPETEQLCLSEFALSSR